jgi:hypothetical protein
MGSQSFSETSTTRLVFKPMLVDNPHDVAAPVKGVFVHQRKSKDEQWEDHNSLPLSKLRAGEWVKVDIGAGEIAKLVSHIAAIKFEEAHQIGEIPWTAAVRDVLTAHGPLRVNAIAQRIAESNEGCDSALIAWRLSRVLSRLEGSRTFAMDPAGAWALLRAPTDPYGRASRQDLEPGRWAHHRITDTCDPEHDALFHLESAPGSHEIVLNRSHPYYEPLRDLLSGTDMADLTAEALQTRLSAASRMVQGLLVAWAEYEDGEKAGARRDRVREARQAWGRAARHVAHSGTAGAVPLSL